MYPAEAVQAASQGTHRPAPALAILQQSSYSSGSIAYLSFIQQVAQGAISDACGGSWIHVGLPIL